MISTNIDIGDRLINGHIRTMKHVDVKQNEVTNIYLALQAPMLDILKINGGDGIAKNKSWVSIKREETSIYTENIKSHHQ